MTDALYDLLYIIDILVSDIFQIGIFNPFGRKQETEADYLEMKAEMAFGI